MAGVAWDMSRWNPADSHSPLTLILQYFIYRLFILIGWKVYIGVEMSSMELEQTQSDLLKSFLHKNKDTVIGKTHNFKTIGSVREFKERMPLSRYKDYEDYMTRIEHGEQNLLTADKVIYLAQSSGTSGRCKTIPVTYNMKGPAAQKFGPLMYYFMHLKSGLSMQRAFVLSYKPCVGKSPGGLDQGPISAHMSRYIPFVIAPRECYEVTNENAAMHVHAVFGFKEPEVGHTEALMSTLMYSFWRYAELNWRSICDDIERGTLNPELPVDSSIVKNLNSYLVPNPPRASVLRKIFQEGMVGVAKRVWPNIGFARMLTTGGFAQHAKYLKEIHMKGVPQLSQTHASSEGFFGFNLSSNPDVNVYTAMITYAFMEFIPVQHVDEANPRTFLVDQVIILVIIHCQKHYAS